MLVRYCRIILAALLIGVQGFVASAQTLLEREVKQALEQAMQDLQNARAWLELVCVPETRLDCGGSACEKGSPTVHVVLRRETLSRGMISRCSGGTCDTYSATVNTGGIFTTLQPTDARGHIVKVRGDDEFIEVASAGLGILFSSGTCKRAVACRCRRCARHHHASSLLDKRTNPGRSGRGSCSSCRSRRARAGPVDAASRD